MARLRTFIALELDRSVRAQLVDLRESLGRAGGDVKWVEPENLHVTLLFLGEVDEREVIGVCRAVSAVCAEQPPISISIEGIGHFGSAKRPRTLWVGVGAGEEELIALHSALETALLDLGCYRREERAFTPHITLGRVRGESDGERLMAAVQKQQDYRAGEFDVRQVVVMSSELRSEGPVYAVLSRANLGG